MRGCSANAYFACLECNSNTSALEFLASAHISCIIEMLLCDILATGEHDVQELEAYSAGFIFS
jgi:hypothetical protein